MAISFGTCAVTTVTAFGLKADYNTPEFWAEYRAAIEGAAPVTTTAAKPRPHSLAWALEKYRGHSAWTRELKPATRRQRGEYLSALLSRRLDLNRCPRSIRRRSKPDANAAPIIRIQRTIS